MWKWGFFEQDGFAQYSEEEDRTGLRGASIAAEYISFPITGLGHQRCTYDTKSELGNTQ